jgi:hypothetical protein
MNKAHPIPHDGQHAPPYSDQVAASRPAKFRYRHTSLQRPHIHEAGGNRRCGGHGRPLLGYDGEFSLVVSDETLFVAGIHSWGEGIKLPIKDLTIDV